MYFITRATPIDEIDGQSHKMKLKSNRNYLTNHTKSKSRHWLFMVSGADTHTHTYPHESDFKKPGAPAYYQIKPYLICIT